MLEEGYQLMENCVSNSKSEQIVSGVSDNRNFFDKTHSISYVNVCSGNTLLNDSRNSLTAYQKLSTEAPPKSKPKIKTKLPPKKKGSLLLTVYHQNIRGLRGKVMKLLSQLYPTFPHILCFSEHHMKHLELRRSHFDNYKLGGSYCRTKYEMGGVCIFVQESMNYVRLDLEKYCQDMDFEVCAIKIHLDSKSVCIIAIYRAPSGNFDLFLSKLDAVLMNLYTATLEYILCGDINMDYLSDSDSKSRLDALLIIYNLTSIVNFPTCIQKNSPTANDNIFIDTSKMDNYTISPIINGLSDHDAQSIILYSYIPRPSSKIYRLIKNINDYTINDFFTNLSYKTWDNIFSTDDVNIMFNFFLDTYLQMLYSSFPLKRVHLNKKHKNWITLGILTACRHKRELFTAFRNNNNPDLLKHNKSYCKILSAVIKEAIKLHYVDKIKKAWSKNKTIWNTVQLESNKTDNTDTINTLNINGMPISDCQKMANDFNKYFLAVAKNITSN